MNEISFFFFLKLNELGQQKQGKNDRDLQQPKEKLIHNNNMGQIL